MLNAALTGELLEVEFAIDPIFGYQVPTSCPEVPDDVLNPTSSWPSQEAYMQKYREMAARFVDNFKKFEEGTPEEVRKAGPSL